MAHYCYTSAFFSAQMSPLRGSRRLVFYKPGKKMSPYPKRGGFSSW